MMHITFKAPLPRVMVMQRSTPVAAANARTITEPRGGFCDLACESFVTATGEDRPIAMRTVLRVHVDHIASINGVPEPKS